VLLARFGTPFTNLTEGDTEENQCVRLIAKVGKEHDAGLKTLATHLNAVGQVRLVEEGIDAPLAPSSAPDAGVDASLELLGVHCEESLQRKMIEGDSQNHDFGCIFDAGSNLSE
jgi:hypothetical protein